MDIVQVRDALRKTTHQFEMDELSDLREDVSVPEETTEFDEDLDLESDDEIDIDSELTEPTDEDLDDIEEDDTKDVEGTYLSYISELSMDISEQTGLSDDEAWVAMEKVVSHLDEVDSIPDVDLSTAEELSVWMSAAKSCDLATKVVERIKEQG